MMQNRNTFVVALLAGTVIVGGFVHGNLAYAAADQSDAKTMSSQEQATLNGDAMKMSRDALTGFTDISHARLSIFDGDPTTAQKLVQDAGSAFERAKTDRTVFVKAEADLQPAIGAKTGKAGDDEKAKAPTSWVPVDGAIVMNEDFTANPAKKAAVADANKKLAGGDRKGAIGTLKLADVDVDLIMAVVPVERTITDIHQANKLMQDGKYYETSQLLRQIEDSVRYDSLNIRSGPKTASAPDHKQPEAGH